MTIPATVVVLYVKNYEKTPHQSKGENDADQSTTLEERGQCWRRGSGVEPLARPEPDKRG
jgi:hypothetical protein